MRHLIFLTLISALFFQSAQTAHAQSSYYILQNSYFSFIPALPITIPQNEQPGDVYTRPGVIFARKVDCFKEAATDSSETYFPSSVIVESSSVGSQLAVEGAIIAKAAADANAHISNNVTVSYGENGKGRWSQIVQRELLAVLQNSKTNDCREKILRALRSPPDNISSIPWIIQLVWYATVNLSYQTTSAIDADAKAKIDGTLSSVTANGTASTKQNSNSLTIAYTGKTAFPVAWRPAFISLEHYRYINELLDQGWLRYLATKLFLGKSDREILEILSKDYKLDLKKLPQPKDVAEGMSHGRAIPFEPENEKHLAYLKGVNALLGVSEAIYGLPGR